MLKVMYPLVTFLLSSSVFAQTDKSVVEFIGLAEFLGISDGISINTGQRGKYDSEFIKMLKKFSEFEREYGKITRFTWNQKTKPIDFLIDMQTRARAKDIVFLKLVQNKQYVILSIFSLEENGPNSFRLFNVFMDFTTTKPSFLICQYKN